MGPGLVLISSPVTLADKPGITAMREEIMALSDSTNFRFVEQFVRGTSPNELPEGLVARLVYESLATPAKVWREWFLGLLQAERSDASVDRQVSRCRDNRRCPIKALPPSPPALLGS